MTDLPLDAWDLTPREADAVQERLAGRVETADRFGEIRTVAGADVGFDRGGTTGRAAVAVLSFPELQPVEESVVTGAVRFPYIPGLLSFREVPLLAQALEGLDPRPDLLLVDGQGLAHPRRCGLACHLGLLADLPSIGVGKSRLLGEHEELPRERGARRPLVDRGEVVGAVVRTRAGVKPVWVSVGHRVRLPTAVELVLQCAPRYRLPEPIRRAHRLASGG